MRKDDLLALFRDIRFYDPYAANGLSKASGHLGIDFSTFAKNRAQYPERPRHDAAETRQDDQCRQRQFPVEIKKHCKSHDSGDNGPGQLHETGAHKIADSLGIGHDTRNKHAGLSGVKIAHRKPHDMCFDAPPHVRDCVLGRDTENLGKRKGNCTVDQGSGSRRQSEQRKQVVAMLSDYLVNQNL